jgi:hypothetical protein
LDAHPRIRHLGKKNNHLPAKIGLGAVMTLWLAAVAGCSARKERKLLRMLEANMDLPNTGLNNDADVYMIKVRQINIKLRKERS